MITMQAHWEDTRSSHLLCDGGEPASARSEVADLLRGIQEGNSRAWEETVRRFSGVVFAAVRAFRLQDADVLDAVQMTWLRLAENAHRVQHPERLPGWLTTTARRECLHILRQQARQTPTTSTDAVVEGVADPARGPEQRAIEGDTAHTLWTLVGELSPLRRALLRTLFTDAPLPYSEVARSAGIPVGGIGPTRARALRQLRRRLAEHGLGPGT